MDRFCQKQKSYFTKKKKENTDRTCPRACTPKAVSRFRFQPVKWAGATQYERFASSLLGPACMISRLAITILGSVLYRYLDVGRRFHTM